ncbi:MAG: glycosyltransferase [Gemmatimonadetes bacterium]|nr:glycosyltransferase [Gemmatimonadota bacterium]
MMIPIFIVLYKMPQIERRCIETLMQHTNLRFAEPIVYDNGPKNQNLAVVWNEMIEHYQGWRNDSDQIGVLLNTDCFVTPGWLEKLLQIMKKYEKVGFVGPMTNNCKTKQKASLFYSSRFFKNRVLFDQRLSGFCLMFRRQAWIDAGRFPEDSPFYGQESALIWNAQCLGWRTAIACGCWVEHLGSASARAAELRGEIIYEEERQKGREWIAAYKVRMSQRDKD